MVEYIAIYNLIGPIFMLAIGIVFFMYPIKSFTVISKIYRSVFRSFLPFTPADVHFEVRSSFSIWIRLLAILVSVASFIAIALNMLELINKQ